MARECTVHECTCAARRAGEQPEKNDHRHLNLILSRLDEQQRRWVAGREATRRGHGGVQQVAEITGLHPETIRIGRDELDGNLLDRPIDRVRLPGGGRPRVEKRPGDPERSRSVGGTGNRRKSLQRREMGAIAVFQAGTQELCGRERTGDHCLPLSAGHIEMESDRASAVQSNHGDVVGIRVEYACGATGIHPPHHNANRSEGNRYAL